MIQSRCFWNVCPLLLASLVLLFSGSSATANDFDYTGDASLLHRANLILQYAPSDAPADALKPKSKFPLPAAPSAVRISYSRILGVLRTAHREIATNKDISVIGRSDFQRQILLAGQPGTLLFSDLSQSNTTRLLTSFEIPDSMELDEIHVIVDRAWAEFGNRSVSLAIGPMTRRNGLTLAAADGPILVSPNARTLVRLDIDASAWVQLSEDKGVKPALADDYRLTGSIRRYEALAQSISGRDLRIFQAMLPDTGWDAVDRVELGINGVLVRYRSTGAACDFDGPEMQRILAERGATSDYPAGGPYLVDQIPRRLILGSTPQFEPWPHRISLTASGLGDSRVKGSVLGEASIAFRKTPVQAIKTTVVSPFLVPGLARLRNGAIEEIRLLIGKAVSVVDGRRYPVEVPAALMLDGLPLTPRSNAIPLCNDYITTLQFALSARDLLGTDPRRGRLANRLSGELLTPAVVLPELGRELDVPHSIRVRIPPKAVDVPTVVRLRELAVLPPGTASGATPTEPQRGGMTEVSGDLVLDDIPPGSIPLGQAQRDTVAGSDDALFNRVMRQLGPAFDLEPDSAMFTRPIEIAVRIPGDYAAEGLTLYSHLSLQGENLWTPNVPTLFPEHKRTFVRKMREFIGAKALADDSNGPLSPDLSQIPEEYYGDLRIGRINKHAEDGYLVTSTNHFCINTLFADLNVNTHDQDYEPLLDGTLDGICQENPVGWVIDENEDVHCGGGHASVHDRNAAILKTRRSIDANGVDIHLRNNVFDYFGEINCDPSGSQVFCYGLDDFRDDVRWAVEVWREAVNRDPDGGYTNRFQVDSWCLEQEDACAGDAIDVGLRDIGRQDVAGWNYGLNVTLDEPSSLDPVTNASRTDRERLTSRLTLRSNLLHELGHALGLSHWAGPGTLMSYAGIDRSNQTRRDNLCAPFGRAQWAIAGNPTIMAPSVLPSDTLDQCTLPEMSGQQGTGDIDQARMNHLSCTDIRRIRRQVLAACEEDGDPELHCSIQFLHCEILTEHTEYAAPEMPRLDGTRAYFEMDFDLRLPHCGATPSLTRYELELIKVDPTNRGEVRNEYREIYGNAMLERGADNMYSIPVRLDSRRLINAAAIPTLSGINLFPSFSEYMDNNDIETFGMVLRAYARADLGAGGTRGEFLAASTGLLRSPILSPLDGQISLGVIDVLQSGDSIGIGELASYIDFAGSDDLFPYIDDARTKPNVGKVLYVTVPPRADGWQSDPAVNYDVRFHWEVPNLQFVYNTLGPMRVWVDSIEISKGDWAVIEQWQDPANGPANLANLTPVRTIPSPAHGDPTLYGSGEFDLSALRDPPVREITEAGATFDAWELYRVRFNYRYKHYHCAPHEDPGAPGSPCVVAADNPMGMRSADFFISIAGPEGAIVHPAAVDSVCLMGARRDGDNSFVVQVNVDGILDLANYLGEEHRFEVGLFGRSGEDGAKIGLRCKERNYGSWTPLEDIASHGIHTLSTEWQNNCNDERYTVSLELRYMPPGVVDWVQLPPLDQMQLRIEDRARRTRDGHHVCNDDDVEYQVSCHPWGDESTCPWDRSGGVW